MKLFIFGIFLCLSISLPGANAQTSTFTYQGRLTVAGTAPTGEYDLRFNLYSQLAGGSRLNAAPFDVENVQVTEGVFTVQLNFASTANAFDGGDRWLEVGMRLGTESGAFAVLDPRQPFTSAPYAIRSLNAGTATNADSLGGVAASGYLQTTGSGANLTNLNAASVTGGTLPDAVLSANVARRDAANTFAGNQTVNGDLSQTGTTINLNVSNGFVARGTFGAGSVPATGEGARMMFYPRKAAFRAGRVSADGSQFWDDANIGNHSFAAGDNPRATGENSIALGHRPIASGANSVAMGDRTIASGESSIALGQSLTSSGHGSMALGAGCRASGSFTTCIGLQSEAVGDFSTVLGNRVSSCSSLGCNSGNGGTNYTGVIGIGDGSVLLSSGIMPATANNQFNVRAAGGIRFFTSSNYSSGVTVAAGGGAWSSLSDRDAKENFAPVNSRDILRKVLLLPISTWNYKTQATSIRHIGAMAQDFKAAFGVGEEDTRISTIDPDGVALAAIQGLNEELTDRDRKIEQQQQQINQLQTALDEQQTTLNALKQLVCAANSQAAVCREK